MIEIKDLVKKFGTAKVLDQVSFTVNKGEILGFLGPNGAGKTTTMKIITSFWGATSGSVSIDGLDVADHSLETRKKIGYLPENVPLYDDMRVDEYLRFIAEVRQVDSDKIKSRIKEVAELCNLEKVLHRPIDELSKGFRQRVGLAQAIIHDPEILILDEPTTGLDPNQIVEIRDLIKRLGKEKTVIFSTHILSEVSATCDRVIIINNGKIVGEGSPSELVAKSGVKEFLTLSVRGDQFDVVEKIRGVESVARVEVKRFEDGIVNLEIEPVDGHDPREAVMRVVINSGWGIVEFTQKQHSLEDVFRTLTAINH
ncbi:ATP-binding cassette domain-containing protein [Candidatus Falkowbacteria bacterium]|nr:ATP-binding cassette domain-containing protein [Candidatus Falkowbacteria bacterium]